MDALEPFRCESPMQEVTPLPYLQQKRTDNSYDINLEAILETENGDQNTLSQSNFKYMYWTMAQQLAHHTSNGCNVRAGDMMGSGTLSGKTKDSYGSMLELTWAGKELVFVREGFIIAATILFDLTILLLDHRLLRQQLVFWLL